MPRVGAQQGLFRPTHSSARAPTPLQVNGVFVELPFMVNRLPEGYKIASTLALAIQAGNVGPAAYALAYRRYGTRSYSPTVYAILTIGVVCCCLLAAFWSVSAGGVSYPLIVLATGLALVDCTSSVVFWPVVARFPKHLLPGLAVGEALGGTLAGALGWIQAANNGGVCGFAGTSSPLFPPSAYFVILAGVPLASAFAYAQLDRTEALRPGPASSRGSLILNDAAALSDDSRELRGAQSGSSEYEQVGPETRELEGKWTIESELGVSDGAVGEEGASKVWSPRGWLSVYGAIAVLSLFQNGVFPSLLPYATVPYGQCVYGVTNSLSITISPLFALLVMISPPRSKSLILWLTALIVAAASFVVALAALGARAPLAGDGSAGAVTVVTIITVASCLMVYVKTAALWLLNATGPAAEAHMRAAGAAMQVGSLIGSCVTFALVQKTRIFDASSA